MEGIFFYWFMWLAWIITTFLMKKGKIRLKLTIFILITIILSELYIIVGDFNVRVSLILFMILGYYLAAKQKKRKPVLFYMITFTLMFAYAGIMLFRIYDPVWFLFDYRIIVSVAISVLAIYLGKHSVQIYALFIISVCQGECLYWFILGEFHDGLTIGTPAFLDMLVIGCSIIYLWNMSQTVILAIEQMLQKPAKEKQG
ncbi:YphA family membrane protein [Metabacillus sp. Hm71]|uniref:YphA family membrane protein n=1 Tax=Metabacillus sp. Hm71 TaxID=3450743 RepID=UPI003F441E62